ncbi:MULTISPECIES: hypothetical protein [unclassified Bradyrhizobium]
MTSLPPPKEFGTRTPAPVSPPPRPPAKRSAEIVLMLMGTLAVGGTAYLLMPSETCERPPNGAAPSFSQGDTECRQRGSSSSSHGSSGGSRYSSSGSSSSHSASGTPDSGSNHVSRGGFGSFAHAFGFSGG